MKKFIRIDKDPEYFQIKEKIELPRYDRRRATKNINEFLKHPSIQPQAIRLYEQIFKLHEIMRGIKYSSYDLNIDHENVERRQALLLEFAIQLLAPTIKQSDEMLVALGQDFLAYARKKCRKWLKLLESLLNEPDLVAVLDLDSNLLNEVVSENMKMLAYYQSIRAKERKFAKLFCLFPILTILRFNDMGPAEREKYMHDLLVRLKAPRFGESYLDGEVGIGEREELARIREWDRESVEWFQSL